MSSLTSLSNGGAVERDAALSPLRSLHADEIDHDMTLRGQAFVAARRQPGVQCQPTEPLSATV